MGEMQACKCIIHYLLPCDKLPQEWLKVTHIYHLPHLLRARNSEGAQLDGSGCFLGG